MISGTLTGFDGNGRPLIINQFGQPSKLESFNEIRPYNPFDRQKPNWTDLPDGATIVRPDRSVLSRFMGLLERPIPPGPSALAFAKEIWNRGFEIYLVGGTVRDVLCGLESHDIDFVTTMPLDRSRLLVSSMYRQNPSGSPKRGYVRIGGSASSGDPFVDLKVFSDSLLGTENAAFGVGFERDVSHRDFACNAVYFDPINEVLIDPTGIGIQDSIGRRLTLICNTGDPFQHAQIFIRFFKFCSRGFSPIEETTAMILENYAHDLRVMQQTTKVSYFRAQILNKCKVPSDREEALTQFRDLMHKHGVGSIWDEVFAPLLDKFQSRDGGR